MILALCAGALAACATQSCDPESAGFIGGLGNAMSDCYVVNETKLREQLAVVRQELNEAMQRARDEGQRATDQQFAVISVSAKLANLAQADRELRRRLAAARTRHDVDQARVTAAQEQLDRLEREQNDAQQRANPRELEQLHEQQRALADFGRDF